MIGQQESNTHIEKTGISDDAELYYQGRSITENAQLVAEPGPEGAWLPLLVFVVYVSVAILAQGSSVASSVCLRV